MIELIERSPCELSPSEAQLLMREFLHRINNEFASAIGVIAIAAARTANEEVKAALVAAEDHLQNYAQVHLALRVPDRCQVVKPSARTPGTACRACRCRAASVLLRGSASSH